MKVLSADEIQQKLGAIDNWTVQQNALQRNYTFNNFIEALDFMNQIGALAEAANHHPELHNVYNKLVVRLNTHDANGITDKDFDLAAKISVLR